MHPNETSSSLDIAHQCYTLFVRIEYVIVGVGEHQRMVLAKVFVREVSGVITDVNMKPMLLAQFLERDDGIGDIVMDKTGTVLGIDQYPNILPLEILTKATQGSEQKQGYRN